MCRKTWYEISDSLVETQTEREYVVDLNLSARLILACCTTQLYGDMIDCLISKV